MLSKGVYVQRVAHKLCTSDKDEAVAQEGSRCIWRAVPPAHHVPVEAVDELWGRDGPHFTRAVAALWPPRASTVKAGSHALATTATPPRRSHRSLLPCAKPGTCLSSLSSTGLLRQVVCTHPRSRLRAATSQPFRVIDEFLISARSPPIIEDPVCSGNISSMRAMMCTVHR